MKDNTNSLAYNIINNSLNATNGTELLSYPLTKVAEEISSQTEGNGKSYVPGYADITYVTAFYSHSENVRLNNLPVDSSIDVPIFT